MPSSRLALGARGRAREASAIHRRGVDEKMQKRKWNDAAGDNTFTYEPARLATWGAAVGRKCRIIYSIYTEVFAYISIYIYTLFRVYERPLPAPEGAAPSVGWTVVKR